MALAALRTTSSSSATSRTHPFRSRNARGFFVRAQAPPPAAVAVAPPMPMAPLIAAPAQLQPGRVHCLGAHEVDQITVSAAEAQRLVVVTVSTTWCGPCKVIGPELERMAEELGDKVVLAKMDCTTVQDNRKWAQAQGVKALPTFVLFKNGRRVGDMTGAKAASLRKLIEAHM